MVKHPLYIKSKFEPFEGLTCSKCCELIEEIGDGIAYWNPSPRAIDKNICQHCYFVISERKMKSVTRWKEGYQILVQNAHIFTHEMVDMFGDPDIFAPDIEGADDNMQATMDFIVRVMTRMADED